MVELSMSVVIPTRNNKALLKVCLRSLFDQTPNSPKYEIIVIDDFSSDGTKEVIQSLQSEFPRLIYKKSTGRGVSIARNLGISLSSGEIICFVDSDMKLNKTWIFDMYACFKSDSTLAGVSGTSTNAYPENIYARVSQDIINNNLQVSFTLPTNNCSYRKNILVQSGGFSEEVIIGGEDAELSCRVHRSGKKLLRNQPIQAKHYQVSTLRRFLKQSFFYGYTDHWFKSKHSDFFNTNSSLKYLLSSIKRIYPNLTLSNSKPVSRPILDFIFRLLYLSSYGAGAISRMSGIVIKVW